MKSTRELLFSVICISFSSLLLVLSLLGAVRLAALGDHASDLEAERKQLETENQRLLVAYEMLLNLEEIEKYGIEVLGLQHCSPGQIHTAP